MSLQNCAESCAVVVFVQASLFFMNQKKIKLFIYENKAKRKCYFFVFEILRSVKYWHFGGNFKFSQISRLVVF